MGRLGRIKWRIIRLMIEISRRIWSICFPAFAVLAVGGCTPLYVSGFEYQLQVAIPLWVLSFICLVVAIIAFRYDFKITYRKHYRDTHKKGNFRYL
jgi:hypothetical protein